VETNPGPTINEPTIPCFFLNARSIKKLNSKEHKLREFKELLTIADPYILGVSETWLNKKIEDNDIVNKDEYSIHRKDRVQRKGGGVLVLVKPTIKSERRDDLETSNLDHNEIIVVQIEPSPGNKIAVITAYRSQSDPHSQFLSNLENTLTNCTRANFTKILLLGDFNYPKIKWNPHLDTKLPPNEREFIQVMSSFGLTQINKNPSRTQSNNILDLIFSNFPDKLSRVYSNIFHYTSDHFLLQFDVNITINTVISPSRTVYNLKRANMHQLKTDIDQCNLTDKISNESNINNKLSSWSTTLKDLINLHVPKITLKNAHTAPWIDAQVIKGIRKKNTALAQAKKHDSQALWAKFSRIRNKLKNLITEKHRTYLYTICDNISSNPKRFWSFIKSNTKSRGLPTFLYNNLKAKVDTYLGMAGIFNQYFHSTFTPPTDTPPPPVELTLDPNLLHVHLTEEEVFKEMSKLNPNKANGPDEIPTKILKDCSHELKSSITALFNDSITTGTVPKAWKQANVIPIHKKGTKHEAKNYRPISLLPVISKLLERCLYNKIIDYLIPKITNCQHGFLRNRSTSTQLLQVFSNINNILDCGDQTDVIYFDLSKAFDSVPHSFLIHKLKSFGIGGSLLAWFSDYLTNRVQRVLINGAASEWLPVTSGVPQGSILGPLLFLLYINDLPSVLSDDTLCAIFADDTKIYRHINSHMDLEILQRDINNALNWSQKWGLNFNQSKCTAISLKRNNNPTEYIYKMGNDALTRTQDAPDLGVKITSTLNWNPHINDITNKAFRRMWFLVRTLGYEAPSQSKLTTYISLVRSLIEYNTVVWNPINKESMIAFESVQRKCTNFILNNPRRPSPNHIEYKDRLIQLNLLPLSYRREFFDIIFFIKSLKNMHAYNILDFVQLQNDTNLRVTRNRVTGLTLIAPKLHLHSSTQFYPYRLTFTWNRLPINLRKELTQPDQLISQTKTLLNKYYHELLSNLYEPENTCTHVSACPCSTCRP
jgi:exonuclease III